MKNVKKALSLLLATVLLISVVPSFATDELTDSEASFTTGEGTVGENPVQVSVTKGSTYTITIPKTVILAGSNGEGNYTVKVTGDLSGTEYISVEPYTNEGLNLLENGNTFALSQAGKDDVQATVTQTKTEWSYGNMGDGTGKISVANLTSGSWSGSFKFNINRVETVVMMLEGDGQVVNKFAFPEVRFRSSAPVDTLNEVKINGEVVSPDNYIVTEGSTIITLKNEYVEKLDITEDKPYTIEIVSAKGTADGDFTVVNLIPEGGYYYCANGDEFGPGEEFPSAPQKGDFYEYGDYEYAYGHVWCSMCGWWNMQPLCWCGTEEIDHWGIHARNDENDSFDLPLTQINGDYISDWSGIFHGCSNLKKLPTIPQGVTNIDGAFAYCTSLTDLSDFVIPSQITSLDSTFRGCSALVKAPVIPEGVTNMSLAFCDCSSLVAAPTIPNSATNLSSTFWGCESLITAPVIPQHITKVSGLFSGCASLKTYVGSTDPDGDFSNYIIPEGTTSMWQMFSDCASLTVAPTIPTSVTDLSGAFSDTALTEAPVFHEGVTDASLTFCGCHSLKTYTGSTDPDGDFSNYIIPESVTDMGWMFDECYLMTKTPVIPNKVTRLSYAFSETAITTAPVIPNAVTVMWGTFENCKFLVEAPVIPENVTYLESIFEGCAALATAPVIHSKVTNTYNAFKNCTSLTGQIEIHTNYSPNTCFRGVDFQAQKITLTGSSTVLDSFGATGINYCAECNGYCQKNH